MEKSRCKEREEWKRRAAITSEAFERLVACG